MWSYETIRELAFILSGQGSIRTFQRTFLSSTRDYRGGILLNAILDSSVNTDADAANATDSSATPINVFRAFKSRFIEEVLNCYLTLDLSPTEQNASIITRHRLMIAREAAAILDQLGRRLLALRILQHGIRVASEQRATDEVFHHGRILSQIGRIEGATTYAMEQHTLNRLFMRRWCAEVHVDGLLQRTDVFRYTNIPDRIAYLPTLESDIRLAEERYNDVLTVRSRHNLNLVKVAAATLRGDAEEIDRLVASTVAHVQAHGHQDEFTTRDLLVRQASALLQLRRVDDALSLVTGLSAPQVCDRASWQLYYETLIIACIHHRAYERALMHWNQAETERQDDDPARTPRDHAWALLGGYLALLERIQLTNDTHRNRPFRLRKFLNSLPRPLHPDLRIGLPYLTLEIAFAIEQYDYDQAQRRIDYAVISVARTSRIDAYERYLVFAELLRDLVTCRFDADRIRTFSLRGRRKLEALRSTVMPTLTSEIIPFEALHDIIIEMIQRNDRLS